MTAVLEGVRVLVVEDEYLVAVLIQDILESAGCVVAGPIPRLSEAIDAVDHDTYDVAVLDVNLCGERIDPVAAALSRRNVPFAFVTGYGAGVLSDEFAERPRVCKPFKIADLVGAVACLLKPRIRLAPTKHVTPRATPTRDRPHPT